MLIPPTLSIIVRRSLGRLDLVSTRPPKLRRMRFTLQIVLRINLHSHHWSNRFDQNLALSISRFVGVRFMHYNRSVYVLTSISNMKIRTKPRSDINVHWHRPFELESQSLKSRPEETTETICLNNECVLKKGELITFRLIIIKNSPSQIALYQLSYAHEQPSLAFAEQPKFLHMLPPFSYPSKPCMPMPNPTQQFQVTKRVSSKPWYEPLNLQEFRDDIRANGLSVQRYYSSSSQAFA
jgi:hypothetical protein